jgi:hypothetical protein
MTVTPEDVHVVPGPPLDEGGKESRGKAGHKTYEPVDVHPDVRPRWAKSRFWERQVGRVLCTKRGELIGDLVKKLG